MSSECGVGDHFRQIIDTSLECGTIVKLDGETRALWVSDLFEKCIRLNKNDVLIVLGTFAETTVYKEIMYCLAYSSNANRLGFILRDVLITI